MTEEWMAKLQNVARGEQSILQTAMTQLKTLKKDISRLQISADQLDKRISRAIERLEQGMQELLEMQNDPVVLVRNYGDPDVYHSSESPCGWVTRRSKYKAVLWGDARAAGLEPCSACGLLADADAHRARPKQDERKAG